jgi:hypothetical protein
MIVATPRDSEDFSRGAHSCRWAYPSISDSVEQRICQFDGRQCKDFAFFKRKWPSSKCRRAYLAYERILEEEGEVCTGT